MEFLSKRRIFVLLALTPVHSVVAAPPIAFDSWNEGSVITAGCPNGFTCLDEVNDSGLLQRTLIAGDGSMYVQLVVTGSDQQLGSTSTSESFVTVNGGSGFTGISAKQTVFQNSNENVDAQTIINTGWAESGGEASIAMTVNNSLDYQGASITQSFVHRSDLDSNGNTIGRYTGVDQLLTDTSQVTGSQVGGTDQIGFATRRASGTQNSGGNLSIPGVVQGGAGMMGGMDGMMGTAGAFGDGMIGGGAGGNVSWGSGADVQMSWIGQLCVGCVIQDTGGMGGGGMGGGGMMGGGGGMDMGLGGPDVRFSYQTFDNLVDANDPIAGAALGTTNPFDWNANFGPQPTGP